MEFKSNFGRGVTTNNNLNEMQTEPSRKAEHDLDASKPLTQDYLRQQIDRIDTGIYNFKKDYDIQMNQSS